MAARARQVMQPPQTKRRRSEESVRGRRSPHAAIDDDGADYESGTSFGGHQLRYTIRRGSSQSLASTSTGGSSGSRLRNRRARTSAPTSTEDSDQPSSARQRTARAGKAPERTPARMPLSPVKRQNDPQPRVYPRTPYQRNRSRPFEVMQDQHSPPTIRKRKRKSDSDAQSSESEDGEMDVDSRTPMPRRTKPTTLRPGRTSQHSSADEAEPSVSPPSPDENQRDDIFYVQSAPTWQLRRLRKEKLVELIIESQPPPTGITRATSVSSIASSVDELEELTKDVLVAKIVNARTDDFVADDEREDDEVDDLPPRRPTRQVAIESPARAFESLSLATPRAAGMHRRSQSMPALNEIVGTGRVLRNRNRKSNGDDDSPNGHRLRNGKARQLTELGIGGASGKLIRRVTFHHGEDFLDEDSDEEEESPRRRFEREATPLARRTRSISNLPRVEEMDNDELDMQTPRRTRNAVPVEEDVDELASDQDEEEVDIESATTGSLLKLKRDDLVRLCQERDLDDAGTKKDLVQNLMDWRGSTQDDSTIASSSSSDEDAPSSNDSAATLRRARNETKTQALASIDDSVPAGVRKPLLLDTKRPARSPTKPDTPPSVGEEDEEEVSALDLESLNLADKAIPPEKLKRGDKIGSGGFKDVYAGRYRNVRVAIADLRGSLTEMDIRELELLRDLRHDNVVRFIGVSVPEDAKASGIPCSLITELCLNGDLFDYLRSDAPPPTFDKAVGLMLDITKGIEYLHTRQPMIIHRDVKSSNVLITARGIAKITDFGLARIRSSTRSVIHSLVGTVKYVAHRCLANARSWQAPELWTAKPKYNELVDVYACGLVFWEILSWHQPTRKYPFEGMNEHAIFQNVGQKQERPPTATLGRKWSTSAAVFAELLSLVHRMWANSPSERPSSTGVLIALQRVRATHRAT